MKAILKLIGKIVKLAGIILIYLLAKGLILTLLNGWLMIIAYLLLVATAIVLTVEHFKKRISGKESK